MSLKEIILVCILTTTLQYSSNGENQTSITIKSPDSLKLELKDTSFIQKIFF